MSAPRQLTGRRVKLGAVAPRDAEAIYRAFQDTEITRNTLVPLGHRTINGARDYIRAIRRSHRADSGWFWAIRDVDSSRFQGMIYLRRVPREDESGEIAYWLAREYRGRGLMTESLRLCLSEAFRFLCMKRVFANVFTRNEQSVRLLLRAGFTYEATLRSLYKRRNRWHDVAVYSILREEWRQVCNTDRRIAHGG